MQSGSVNQPPRQGQVQRKPPLNETPANKNAEAAAETVAEQESGAPAPPQPEVPSGDQVMPFAGVTDITIDDLALKPDGKGGFESSKTFALVDKADRERLEAEGAIFPKWRNETLGDGVGPGGDLGIAALRQPEDKNKVEVPKGVEVDKKLAEIDPNTGKPFHDSLTAVILNEGESVLGPGQKAISVNHAPVISAGWKAVLADTDESKNTESRRVLVNNITKGLGTFSGSSLAGIMRMPVISTYAPLLALGTTGFTFNSQMEEKRETEKLLGQLDTAQAKALKTKQGDLVEIETAEGFKFKVSGKAERSRLETKLRQNKMQRWSSYALLGSGGASIIGSLASAGVAGYAGMAAAGAATPFLAGGALVLGQGGMVFNALSQLNELGTERKELLKLQAEGQTHVDRVIEKVDPNLRRHVAVGDKPVSVPISERLKEIEKAQRTQRLMATAMGGGMVSIGGSVTGLASMSVLGPLALAPAGLIAVGQSGNQLRVLGKEKRELKALEAEGQTMVERPLQQQDGTWREERIPISTLLAENKKEVNKHKMILTGVGTVGGMMGLTLGAGMSLAAAAPLVLVPLAIGAALFPDKVKAFAGMVGDIIGGVLGDAGQTKRAAKKANKKKLEGFNERLDEKFAGLKESQPELFESRPGYFKKLLNQPINGPVSAAAAPLKAFKAQPGGYFTEMKELVKAYAEADSVGQVGQDNEGRLVGSGRAFHMARINQALSLAPDEAKPGLQAFVDEVQGLQMEVEAEWLARDIKLEMVTDTTRKIVNDDRVKARLDELEFDTDYDSVRAQYEETLQIENSQEKQTELMEKAQQGDREATLKLSRTEVFKAARNLAKSEKTLGNKLFTRYMDAIEQPENEENLELLMKEVGYKQQQALTGDDIQEALNSLNTLTTPLSIPPSDTTKQVQGAVAQLREADPEATSKMLKAEATLANPAAFRGLSAKKAVARRSELKADLEAASKTLQEKAPDAMKTWSDADQKTKSRATAGPVRPSVALEGPQARMEIAFRGLSKARPELTKQLGDAFAVLNTPGVFEGMDAQQTQHAKVAAKVKLDKVRKKLTKKEPELMELWENARGEVAKSHFERSVDHKFKAKVLSTESVTKAAKEFGLSEEDVDGLYMGVMKLQIMHDSRDLDAKILNEQGETDPSKSEMVSVIDHALHRTAAELTDGGADFVAPDPNQSPLEDPAVINLLQQQPQIGQVLGSPQFMQLAENMQLPPEEVRDAYLTIVQAELNPARLTEFQGLVAAGDMQTVKTMQVGQAVVQLISQMTQPDPEAVKEQVEVSMQGAIAQAVLGHPDVASQSEALQVDAESTMRMLLKAEISRDPSELAALEEQASEGVTAAKNQLQLLQTLSRGIQHFSQMAQQQMENPPAA